MKYKNFEMTEFELIMVIYFIAVTLMVIFGQK